MPLSMHPEIESRLRCRAQAEGVTVDQYVERLMQDEDAGMAHTEALLQEAANSGDYIELNEQEWDRIEREAVAEVEAKAKRRV